jgi:hypothetical protein
VNHSKHIVECPAQTSQPSRAILVRRVLHNQLVVMLGPCDFRHNRRFRVTFNIIGVLWNIQFSDLGGLCKVGSAPELAK